MFRPATLWALCALAALPAHAVEPSFDEENVWLPLSTIESYADAIRRGGKIIKINGWGDSLVLFPGDGGVPAPDELSQERKRLRRSVTVIGILSPQAVERAAALHAKDLLDCQQASKREGVVVVKFVVSPSGKYATGAVVDTTLDDPMVEACLLATAKSWTFPPSPNSGVSIVTYPFQLR